MCIHCVLTRIRVSLCGVVFYYMFMCIICFGSAVRTSQMTGQKKSSDDTFMW